MDNTSLIKMIYAKTFMYIFPYLSSTNKKKAMCNLRRECLQQLINYFN